MFSVNIKWGKETFKGIEVDTNGDVSNLKAVLYSLTCVPPDRQKILVKGRAIKDEADLTKLGIKKGITMMLMGTAEEAMLKTVKAEDIPKFDEDMTDADRKKFLEDKGVKVMPPGLYNLGNTCCINASLQCLRKFPEMNKFLMNRGAQYNTSPDDKASSVVAAYTNLMIEMDKTAQPVNPSRFLMTFWSQYPLYNEKGQDGNRMQQDGEEIFGQLMSCLDDVGQNLKDDIMDKLFTIRYECKMQSVLHPEEPPSISYEMGKKLSVVIINQNKPVNTVQEGIQAGLETEIEKYSEEIGGQALYNKIQRISQLPCYVILHYLRFGWKEKSESAGTMQTRTKILRNVPFPRVLDLYDFCSETLKKQLDIGKADSTKQYEEETKAMIDKKATREESKGNLGNSNQENKNESVIDDKILYREHGLGLDTGKYELVGILTHQGRSGHGGHYVGWVHCSGDEWYKYDDNIVSQVNTNEIMALSGGGDHHAIYLGLYRKREVILKARPKEEPEVMEEVKMEEVKMEDVKMEDVKMEDVKMEDVKMEDVKMEEKKEEGGDGPKPDEGSVNL